MSVFYRIIQDKNIKSKNHGKFLARAVHPNSVSLADLASIIERNCSMKRSDVVAVLTELVEVMRDKLQNSCRVRVDGLGIFKIGLKTKPADSKAKFSANNIVGFRVNFLPEYTVEKHAGTDGKGVRSSSYYLLQGVTAKLAEAHAGTAAASGTGSASGTDSASGTGSGN